MLLCQTVIRGTASRELARGERGVEVTILGHSPGWASTTLASRHVRSPAEPPRACAIAATNQMRTELETVRRETPPRQGRTSIPAEAWSAPTTTDKDRKQLLRSLLEEVNIAVHRDHTDAHAELLLRWKGGAITDLSVPIKRKPINRQRTAEDTVDLVRRLAAHYPDAMIAHILNRQGRRTARGLSFTAGRVQSLRHHYEIPCHTSTDDPTEGEPLTVADAAAQLGLAASTLHRWLADGFITGEQLTPAAPWRIRLTDDIRNLFVDDAPNGWLAMLEATLAYGVSRQTIMQRVKRGELKAVHVRTGRRKGLRIQPPPTHEGLF
jgi:hypothetical protein